MRLLMASIIAASVVDLPEPVLPVTRIMPCVCLQRFRTTGGMFSSSRVSACDGIARKYGTNAIQVPHDINSKSRDFRNLVGKVDGIIRFEVFLQATAHDFVQRVFDHVDGQFFVAEQRERPVYAHPWWITRDEMQVRAAFGERIFQVLVDLVHVRHPTCALPPSSRTGRMEESVTKRWKRFLSDA